MKLTDRSAQWMETVVANCKANTDKTLAQWVALAKKAGAKDAPAARAWAKTQGLSSVYQNAVMQTLFPPAAGDDDAMVAAQYAGAKAALRPVYDAIVRAAHGLGDDVEVMPRKSQVTLSRTKTFAIVRAAARDRVDVLFKLHGEKATPRLILEDQATKADPSHAVAVRSVQEVDPELVGWLRKAYERASSPK